jgi:hypothetical protein
MKISNDISLQLEFNSIQFMPIPTYKISISSISQVDDDPLYLQIEQFLPQQTLLKP